MTACAAILKIQYKFRRPLICMCENSAIHVISGVPLCGTHVNALSRGEIRVVTTIPRIENIEKLGPDKGATEEASSEKDVP